MPWMMCLHMRLRRARRLQCDKNHTHSLANGGHIALQWQVVELVQGVGAPVLAWWLGSKCREQKMQLSISMA